MVNFTSTCEFDESEELFVELAHTDVVVVSLSYYYPFVVCLAESPVMFLDGLRVSSYPL